MSTAPAYGARENGNAGNYILVILQAISEKADPLVEESISQA
jgi:hypothetical protein